MRSERGEPLHGEIPERPVQPIGVEIDGQGLHTLRLLIVEMPLDRQDGQGLAVDVDR